MATAGKKFVRSGMVYYREIRKVQGGRRRLEHIGPLIIVASVRGVFVKVFVLKRTFFFNPRGYPTVLAVSRDGFSPDVDP